MFKKIIKSVAKMRFQVLLYEVLLLDLYIAYSGES